MANRNRMSGGYDNRRQSGGNFNRNYERGDNYGRQQFNPVSPWQGGMAPSGPTQMPTSMPSSTEATLALANNLISNLLQTRHTVPSLLDIPVHRQDFGYNRGYDNMDRPRPPMRMGGGRGMHPGGAAGRRQVGARVPVGARRPQHPPAHRTKPPQNKNLPAKKDSSENNVKVESAGDEEGEGKREWKQEKNAVGENEEDTPGEGGDPDSSKKVEVSTQYDGITAEFLECHICEKKMWDGRSFENHIKGRAHHIMMDKTRESYKMTADAMRQELKISEMRRNKRGPATRKTFCAMCDLYVVTGSAHRRSPGHQKLKKYLHPSCNACRKEMPTRIELDEHRLTPQHMKIIQEKQKEVQTKPKVEAMIMSTLADEQSQIRPLRIKPIKKTEGEATEDVVELKIEDGDEPMPESKPEEVVPTLLLDYEEGTDLSSFTRENLPRYNPERSTGDSYVVDFNCKQCLLCKKLFDTEETAEVHKKTWKHFQCFLRLLHSKGNFKQETGVKRELPEEGKEDEEGNWKRRKVEGEENGDANEEVLQQNGDVEEIDTATNGDVSLTSEDKWDASINEEIDNLLDDTKDTLQTEVAVDAPETEVAVASPPVKQSPQRGRGRGRGNRARRGTNYNRV